MNEYQQSIILFFIGSLLIGIFVIFIPIYLFCGGNVCWECFNSDFGQGVVILSFILECCIFGLFNEILKKYQEENHNKKKFQDRYPMIKAFYYVIFGKE